MTAEFENGDEQEVFQASPTPALTPQEPSPADESADGSTATDDSADDSQHEHEHEHEAPVIPPEQLERLRKTMEQDVLIMSRIMGISGVQFKLGKDFSTDLQTGQVTLSLADLINPELPDDWNEHGVLHELAAHLRTMVREPLAVARERQLSQQGKPHHFFMNIVTDIKGNKLIMRTLPRMRGVTDELYSEYLFEQDDLSSQPRHVQLMNALIMQEMSPDREVMVSEEVQAAIQSLRQYEGRDFDVVKYITRVNKSLTEEMTSYESIVLASKIILPVFEQFLEADRADPRFQSQSGEGEQGEGQGSDSGEIPGYDFSEHYDKSMGKQHAHHGEESDDASHDKKIDEMAKAIKGLAQSQKDKTPQQKLEEAIQAETGHSFAEYQEYMKRMDKLGPEIESMNEFFRAIIDERVVRVRKLSRPTAEGSILDPTVLAQTYVDVQADNPAPPAYHEHEWKEREREVTGRFDIFLAVDASGSMQASERQMMEWNEPDSDLDAYSDLAPCKVAADTALIILEGLDGFTQMIQEEEQRQGVQLDLDVRTSLHVFGSDSECVKPLSNELDRKERLDVFFGVQTDQGTTGDYLALQNILAEVRNDASSDRQRIIFFIADGGSDSPALLTAAIRDLRAEGCILIPIALGQNGGAMKAVVGGDVELVRDVETLPDWLTEKLKHELSARL